MLLAGLLLGGVVFNGYNSPVRKSNAYVYLSAFFLIAITGLRESNVGSDTQHYKIIFDHTRNIRQYGDLEIGFRFLEVIVHYISDNYTVFFLVCACISILPLCIMVKKYSCNIPESVFLYVALGYYFYGFNAMRQTLAISLTVCSYFAIVEKKKIKATIFMLIAFSFHYTSLVCLANIILYYINSKNEVRDEMDESLYIGKQQKKFLFVSIVGVIVLGISFNTIIEKVSLIDWRYAHFFLDRSRYAESGHMYMPFINTVIWLFLVFCTFRDNKAKKKYLIPSTLAMIFSIMQIKMVLFARFVWYFDIFNIFIVPELFKDNIFTDSSKKIVKAIIYFLCIVIFIYYMVHNYQLVIPYKFFSQR